MRFTPLILRHGEKAAWFAMPHVIDRVMRFTTEHSINAVSPLPQIIVSKFGQGDPSCLCIAILDSEEQKVVGHLIATVEIYLGEHTAFIHQWEMDKELVREASELRSTIDSMVETWATTCGLKSITAQAESDSRVRLFKQNNYEKMCTLVRKVI